MAKKATVAGPIFRPFLHLLSLVPTSPSLAPTGLASCSCQLLRLWKARVFQSSRISNSQMLLKDTDTGVSSH